MSIPEQCRERGQTSTEWLGILVVVAAVIAALLTVTDLGSSIAQAVTSLICRIGGGRECGPILGSGDEPADQRTAAAQARADAAEDEFAPLLGAADDELLARIAAAIEAGDLDTAEALLDRLEFLGRLVADPERGAFVADLFGASDDQFAALIADDTIYLQDGRFNTAYFQLANPPGGGVIVMDYFIDGRNSLMLEGDDRGHGDPFGGDLPLEASRVMIVVDLETGRGQVLQTETCFAGGSPCNEPRPIVFDGSFLSNDRGNDATGEGINLDMNNQYTVTPTDGGFRLDYDVLNSITPAGSIDGGVTVVVGPDGRSVALADDDREHYPSIGTYYYRPGAPTQVVEQREQEGVTCGAIPIISHLC